MQTKNDVNLNIANLIFKYGYFQQFIMLMLLYFANSSTKSERQTCHGLVEDYNQICDNLVPSQFLGPMMHVLTSLSIPDYQNTSNTYLLGFDFLATAKMSNNSFNYLSHLPNTIGQLSTISFNNNTFYFDQTEKAKEIWSQRCQQEGINCGFEFVSDNRVEIAILEKDCINYPDSSRSGGCDILWWPSLGIHLSNYKHNVNNSAEIIVLQNFLDYIISELRDFNSQFATCLLDQCRDSYQPTPIEVNKNDCNNQVWPYFFLLCTGTCIGATSCTAVVLTCIASWNFCKNRIKNTNLDVLSIFSAPRWRISNTDSETENSLGNQV